METAESGSSVRPLMMYQAMQQSGHEIHLVSGSQARSNRVKRKATVLNAMNWLNNNQPDLCYIESPTYPIIHGFDRKLIRAVVKKGIPTAYFYRDMYLKFSQFRKESQRGLLRIIKDTGLIFLQYLTDNLLKKVDIVYFPTPKASEYFGYKNKLQLMPAARRFVVTQKNIEEKICIYVGGLADLYGSKMLFDAFKILNNDSSSVVYRLILVCREPEYKKSVFYQNRIDQLEWLSVHHVSGYESLKPLYEAATVALLPQKPMIYTNMAIGVKFFEYLGEGLPIVSAGALEMSNMIRKNNLGVVTKDTPDDFARGIAEILSDYSMYEDIKNSIAKYMKNNLWTNRVEQIIDDLLNSDICVENCIIKNTEKAERKG
jgi:glycosyltransferase involved in cell wall biosynthesis